MESKYINSLMKLGLTSYEAKAYLALNSLISSNAVKISEKSNIPRSKIYDVLKKLEEKNFVEIERGRPLIFNVVAPYDVLEKEKTNLINEIDDLEEKLNEIYEKKIPQVDPLIWRISGVEKIINKELEIIKRSKKSIYMRIGFLFKDEGEKLIKALKNKNSSVEIKIIGSPYFYLENNKVDIFKMFKKNDFSTVEKNLPFVKMMISDSNEMLHTYSKFSGENKNVEAKSAIGVWNRYEDISKIYNIRFLEQFNKIQLKSIKK